MASVPNPIPRPANAARRPAIPKHTRPDDARPVRVLRIDEVMSRTGLRRTAIYELEARGEFPARVNLTARAVGWVESAVESWLLDRIGECRARTNRPSSQPTSTSADPS